MFSGIFLQSAAALLVNACQRVRRARGLNYFFALARFHFPGAGAGVFRQISTIGGDAFSVICMSVGPEGELRERFFCGSVVQLFRSGGSEGERASVDLYPRRRRFWCMHASLSEGRAY